MKKSFMSNIKHFVDSNVLQRIDRVAYNNTDLFDDDLVHVERQFEDLKELCVDAEKRISSILLTLSLPQTSGYHMPTTISHLSHNLSNTSGSFVEPSITNSHPKSVDGNRPNSCNSNTQSSPPPSSNQNKLNDNFLASSKFINSRANKCVNYSVDCSPPNQVPDCDAFDYIRDDVKRLKKLPFIAFLKFLAKARHRFKPHSNLGITTRHCTEVQSQLTKLLLNHEKVLETQCLKPIQHFLESDIPNVIRLRKLFIKSFYDLESTKTKYNGASQKQQQYQQAQNIHSTSASYTITQVTNSSNQGTINKLDTLKKELEDGVSRFEQARDAYAMELYAFVCRETELVDLLTKLYQYQADYHQQVSQFIQKSLPALRTTLADSPRKLVFGTPLHEHLKCIGRPLSCVIELCVHFLHSGSLKEEGLFRVPGSSVKIKKLKHAINAWFVTLASQHELTKDSSRDEENRAPLMALYELFKDSVGQRKGYVSQITDLVGTDDMGLTTAHHHNHQLNQVSNSAPPSSLSNSIQTGSNASQTSSPDTIGLSSGHDYKQQQLVDSHTIAGLLKLYLRELPEPLFTFDLYDDWIRVTKDIMSNDSDFDSLRSLLDKLPKTHHDNLKHLIRFLHLLTTYKVSNKMTSTNLAIAMAPSLIWSRRNGEIPDSSTTPIKTNGEDPSISQRINMQISDVGMTASMHVCVIETLINHADQLFPSPIQFSIPFFREDSMDEIQSSLLGQSRHDRGAISSSPTALSTSSCSSFSCSSNSSTDHPSHHTISKKSSSMEGIPDSASGNTNAKKSLTSSVEIPNLELKNSIQPPPIPPAPSNRLHPRQSETKTSRSMPPPPPPPISVSPVETQYSHHDTSSTVDQSDSLKGVNVRKNSICSSQPPERPRRAATIRGGQSTPL